MEKINSKIPLGSNFPLVRSLTKQCSPKLKRRNSVLEDIELENQNDNYLLRNFTIVSTKSFVLYPDESFRSYWDILILMLILYSDTIMPYYIANAETFEMVEFDTVIDFLFILDIFFNFFTAYVGPDGRLVISNGAIVKKYLTTWFFVDLLVAFPYQLIENSGRMRTYRIFRFIKAARIYKIGKKLKVFYVFINKFLKVSFTTEQLIVFFLILCLIIHVFGCSWLLISNTDISESTWDRSYFTVVNINNNNVYIASLYWVATTIFTIGFGDIVAENDTEKILSIVIMIICIFFFSYLVSSVFSILTFKSKNNPLLLNLRTLQELEKNHKLPKQLVKRIEKALKYSLEQSKKDHRAFALSLSNKVSRHLLFIMNKKLIENNLMLIDKPENFIRDIVLRLKVYQSGHDENFYVKNDLADEIFMINYGKVGFYVNGNIFETVFNGDYFGDAEIFHREYREFNVKSLEVCEVFILDKFTLLHCLSEYEEIKIQTVIVAYKKWKKLKIKEHKIIILNESTEKRELFLQTEGKKVYFRRDTV